MNNASEAAERAGEGGFFKSSRVTRASLVALTIGVPAG
jgi:hypothetical protein